MNSISKNRLGGCKKALLFMLLAAFSCAAYAQTAPAKKKKVKAAAPDVTITLDTAAFNLAGGTANVVGAYQYNVVNLKFYIAGKPPKANVPVKLAIEDYTTTAGPQFNKIPAAANSLTLSIDKSLFPGLGAKDTIILPVTLKLKKLVNEKGSAYLRISGHKEFARLVFNKPAAPKTKHSITLLGRDTTVQLDTLNPNKLNNFAINLKLKLSKAAGIDTTVEVVLDQVGVVKGLVPSVDSLTIVASDWSSKKDTVITIKSSLQVRQTLPLTRANDLRLKLNNGNETVVVKLTLPKTTAGPGNQMLVKSGGARIISSAKPQRVYTSPAGAIDSISMEIKLSGGYDPLANRLAFGFFDSLSSKHFKILNPILTIDSAQWNTAKSIYVPLYIQTVNTNDSLNNLKNVLLILKGQSNINSGSQRIKVTVKDKPFWAEIGTNFDLLDNVKTNNFYAGVFMFDKDVGRVSFWKIKDPTDSLKRKPKSFFLSFTAGVYEAQSVNTGSSFDLPSFFRDGSSTVYNNNGTVHQYKYSADTGIIKSRMQVKSIGLFFSPHFLLTDGKTEENGFHLYASLYMELLWQRVSAGIDYSQTKQIAQLLLDSNTNIPATVPYRQQSFDLDYRSHYYGVGTPIYIKSNEYTLYINSVWGVTNQGFTSVSGQISPKHYVDIPDVDQYYAKLLNVAGTKSRWNSFYVVQYRLSEVTYGVTFSGEVRGLLLSGAKPVVTLALSKKFSLSGVLKPVVAAY